MRFPGKEFDESDRHAKIKQFHDSNFDFFQRCAGLLSLLKGEFSSVCYFNNSDQRNWEGRAGDKCRICFESELASLQPHRRKENGPNLPGRLSANHY